MYLSYYIPLLYSTYSTTFINYIEENMFLDMKKISNICPIHEKGDIQAINNFRLVFALPMLGRLFKRLIFNCLFVYLEERRLLSAYQFGCRAKARLCKSTAFHSPSYIYSFWSILYSCDSLGFFLYVQGFCKVWYNGLNSKLKSISISISIGIIRALTQCLKK